MQFIRVPNREGDGDTRSSTTSRISWRSAETSPSVTCQSRAPTRSNPPKGRSSFWIPAVGYHLLFPSAHRPRRQPGCRLRGAPTGPFPLPRPLGSSHVNPRDANCRPCESKPSFGLSLVVAASTRTRGHCLSLDQCLACPSGMPRR